MVKKEIDWAKVETLASLKLSCQVVCDYLSMVNKERIGHTTLEERIKQEYGMTWGEFRDSRMAPVKAQLVQKALGMALAGNVTLLIFCLKNINDWTDAQQEKKELQQMEIKLSYKAKKEPKKQEAIEVESVVVDKPQ
jgi:hypothetical protein